MNGKELIKTAFKLQLGSSIDNDAISNHFNKLVEYSLGAT